MEKNRHFTVVRAITFLIIAIVCLILAAHAGAAEVRKAYISAQDGSKLYIVDLSKNSIVKTHRYLYPDSAGEGPAAEYKRCARRGEKDLHDGSRPRNIAIGGQ